MSKTTLLVLSILLLGLLLRILPIREYNFPFTIDQGRDMLYLRSIVVGHHPVFIGPVTDITGLFLGPFWYYFNIPAFIIGRGDPSFLVYWVIAWYLLVGWLWWYVFRKRDPVFGLIMSWFFLLTPTYIFISRYALNSNLIPVFESFFFILFYLILRKQSLRLSFLLGLISGICLQLEAAFGVSLFPFALVFFIFTKQRINILLYLTAGFLLTLIPQFLFEIKHNFSMSKSFLDAITGKNPYLLDNFPSFLPTFESHRASYFRVIDRLFDFNSDLIRLLIAASVVWLILIFRKKIKSGLKKFSTSELHSYISGLFLLLLFLSYQFFNHSLKPWFLDGIFLPFLILVSGFLTFVFNKGKTWRTLVAIFLITSTILTFKNQFQFIHLGGFTNSDKSDLKNQLEAIDKAYQFADNKAFKSYIYTGSVYDFTYQYLFWWYGEKRYSYHPNLVTYQDNAPKYLPDNTNYFKGRPLQSDIPLILIIEKEDQVQDRRYAWLGNFVKFCLVDERKLISGTVIQKRVECSTGDRIKSSI